MSRKYHVALGVMAVASVFVSRQALSYHNDPGPARLSQVSISYHVKDDDKDHDSYESLTVSCG
jgi:hypothetical protein